MPEDPDFVTAEHAARERAGRARAKARTAPPPPAAGRLVRSTRGWMLHGELLRTGDLVEVWANPVSGWVRGRVRSSPDALTLVVVLTTSADTDLDPERTTSVLTGPLPAGTQLRRYSR